MSPTPETAFADALRRARARVGASQLALALDAGASQRHISRLERGHVRPSRAMVLRLAQALRLSLRQRNHLLEAAGFRSAFPDNDLADEAMAELRTATELMLHQLAPNPALAADRHWNLYTANGPMLTLLAVLDGRSPAPPGDSPPAPLSNLMQWIWQPDGLRLRCRNWKEIAPWIWRQLCDDAATADSPVLDQLIAQHAAEIGPLGSANSGQPVPPMLPLELDVGGQALRLVSLITRFGSPSSATAEELRIETFIPADDTSRKILNALVA